MAKRSDADRVEKLETDARTLRSVAKALEARRWYAGQAAVTR